MFKFYFPNWIKHFFKKKIRGEYEEFRNRTKDKIAEYCPSGANKKKKSTNASLLLLLILLPLWTMIIGGGMT